eukprot:gb/GEZN01018951.1/.p1 GENE.gb/GEZN01018951.1/~~gb/GEZN01018951.1/.p1  ORF type:complete len:218 (-),score=39.95 gb/GEZN01018951.1/:45-698(-)
MAATTEWSTGHSNAWPPTEACPQTAPFRIGGKVVKTYPLTVKLNHKTVATAGEKDVPGLKAKDTKDAGPKEVKYTAVEVAVSSYIRMPAEGEECDDKPINEAAFRKNFDAYLEYWMGYEAVEKLPKMERKIPNFWTGKDTFVFWAPEGVLGDKKQTEAQCKAGVDIDLTTGCSTNTIARIGEPIVGTKKGGLALDQDALARFKISNKEEADEDGDWD